jgi:hypothetical protein
MPTLHGVVRGRTILLENETGLVEGQEVIVQVEPKPAARGDQERKHALERAAGTWSDDPEGLADFLDWNRRQRKIDRPDIA